MSNHEESLEKTIEQVEDNLKRSTKRAINAESTIAVLQKDIDSLTVQFTSQKKANKKRLFLTNIDFLTNVWFSRMKYHCCVLRIPN